MRACIDVAREDWLGTGLVLMEAERDLGKGQFDPALRRYAEAMAGVGDPGAPYQSGG